MKLVQEKGREEMESDGEKKRGRWWNDVKRETKRQRWAERVQRDFQSGDGG